MSGFEAGRGSHDHICPICGEQKDPIEESCRWENCEDQIEYGSPTECLQQAIECVDLAIEESTFAVGSDDPAKVKEIALVNEWLGELEWDGKRHTLANLRRVWALCKRYEGFAT